MLYSYLLAYLMIQEKIPFDKRYCKEIKELCIQEQLVDKREFYFLKVPKDIDIDFSILKDRRKDLAGVPKVGTVAICLDGEYIYNCLTFNRKYRDFLRVQSEGNLDRADFYNRAMRECDVLYELYTLLQKLQMYQSHVYSDLEYYPYLHSLREDIKRIIYLIGEENYYKHNFPPHVPLWSFTKLN